MSPSDQSEEFVDFFKGTVSGLIYIKQIGLTPFKFPISTRNVNFREISNLAFQT